MRLEQVVDIIQSGQHFAITGHRNPDGDVLGSMSALAEVLTALGKDVTCFHCDKLPRRYEFLPRLDTITDRLPSRCDALFLVDCNDPDRAMTGLAALVAPAPIVALDHHTIVDGVTDPGWIDPEAASVGVLVYRLARALNVVVDHRIGAGIYTSLVSDTGCFRFANTNEEALSIAAHLLSVGLDAAAIQERIHENEPLARFKALAEALSALRLSSDGRVAWMLIPENALEAGAVDVGLLDGAVDYGRRVSGVEVSCLIRPSAPGDMYRVSLRSKGRVNVEEVARALGGGGHVRAAGCMIAAGDVREAGALVEAELAPIMERPKA